MTSDGRIGGAHRPCLSRPLDLPPRGHLREDRGEVRRPEVLGDLGQGRRRRSTRPPRDPDRARATRRPQQRRLSASGSKPSTTNSELSINELNHDRERRGHDGAAHHHAARFSKRVFDRLRLRRRQSRRAGARCSCAPDFAEFGLENEVRDLERFYESVRLRARGLDNAEARQRVLMELYERFFATALKKGRRPARHRLHARRNRRLHPRERRPCDFADEFGRGLSGRGRTCARSVHWHWAYSSSV